MKSNRLICLLFMSTFSAASFAAGLPISAGIKAGATDVNYQDKSAIGYYWSLNVNYRINQFTSISSGYGQTTANIDDAIGVEQEFKSTSIPLALQFNFPVLDNFYVKGGANYYENTFGNSKEDGLGLLGAVGIRFSLGAGPSSAIELAYREAGDAKISTVSVGASISF